MSAFIASRSDAMKDRKRPHAEMSKSSRTVATSIKTKAMLLDMPDDNPFSGKDVSLNTEFEPMSLQQASGQMSICHDPDCKGCTWRFGKPLDPTRFPRMNKIWNCFYENFGKTSGDSLYYILERKWDELFVAPFKNAPPNIKAQCPGEWKFDKIKAHFEQPHAVFLEIELDHDFNDLRDYCSFIKRHLAEKDVTSGKVRPNEVASNLWFKAIEKKQNTWKMIMQERRR
jgi:hypothetical protein